ncbi:membrane-spanning 4-domains subfamily A member 8-like [Ambystoma mexicanum]|uniref:membrane-spanning 4-domains subfamily A member 8-like n=1 Tax=Ambystoma mexicanum TaxID=8296 RepID=UPI0037E922B9
MNRGMAECNGVVVVTHVMPQMQPSPIQACSEAFQNAWCQVPQPLQRFIKGEPKALGVAQILIGVIQMILGIIIATSMGVLLSISVLIGIPFWVGIFFIISGSLSIAAERNGRLCLVKGSLGMNIVSALAAFIGIIFYAIDLLICSISYNYLNGGMSNPHHQGEDDVSRKLANSLLATVKGIEGLLLVFMIFEFCISIATSAFGCKAACCDSTSDMQMIVQQSDPRLQATCPAMMPPPPMYHQKEQFNFA